MMIRRFARLYITLLLLATVYTCSNRLSPVSTHDYGSVAPKVQFNHGAQKIRFPTGAALVLLQITNEEYDFDTSAIFPYYLKQGEINGIPVGNISIGVAGLDVNGDTVYWGDTTGVTLKANASITPVLTVFQNRPNAPSDLQAQVVSPTQVQLTWKDNSSNEKRFYAVINGKTDTSFSVNANDTIMQVTTMVPAQQYNLAVVANNSGGWSIASNAQTVTTDSLFPNNAILPTIRITYPSHGAVLNTNVIQVKAVAFDSNGVAVTVNGLNATLAGQVWAVNLILDYDTNTIVAVATDNSTNQNQAADTILVIYDTTAVDTIPPTLVINALPETTNVQAITLQGTATDANGIKHVLVDSALANGTNQWNIERILVSGKNTIAVVAVDNNDNVALDTIRIYYDSTTTTSNTPPQFTSTSSHMDSDAIVGTVYADTLRVSDVDGDSVVFAFLVNEIYAQFVENLVVTLPTIQDIGVKVISVQVSDGNGGYDTLSWTITVSADDALQTQNGMRLIPAKDSAFSMGSNKYPNDEQPVHTVTFTYDFWLDTTEVTQGQYSSAMNSAYIVDSVMYSPENYSDPLWSSTYGVGSNHPAYYVNWYDAVLYCNAKSKQSDLDAVYSYGSINGTPGNYCTLSGLNIDLTNNGYRLPTEAEWEYACRAGTTTDYYWGTSVDSNYAWHLAPGAIYDSSINKAQEVATKLPNSWGLYDMSGNLYEWCNDWKAEDYYSNSPGTDPTGPLSGTFRVQRGGSWLSQDYAVRSADRDGGYPDSDAEHSMKYVGFRCVRRAE